MEKFKVLPKVEAIYRLSYNLWEFECRLPDLQNKLAEYIEKYPLEKGERLLMFLPSFIFMSTILNLSEKYISPNINPTTMREGLIGELKLSDPVYLWTDALLLPQRYFIPNRAFSKLVETDYQYFHEV